MVDSSWLANCATGDVHCPSIIPGLQQGLWESGFTSLTITPMGGCKVLIHTEEENLVTKLIENERARWSKWFRKIKVWSPTDVAEERLAWIKISRLPLHAWNQKSLEKIDNFLGSFMKVDQFTANKDCLDAARILITTTDANQTDKEVSLKVWSQFHPIKISEERWRTDPWWLKATKVYDSDESDIEDSLDGDSIHNYGNWSFSSDEETERDPLAEKMMSPSDSKMNVVVDASSADFGKSNENKTEGSMSEYGCSINNPSNPTPTPSADFEFVKPKLKDQYNPNYPQQAHTHSIQPDLTTSLAKPSAQIHPIKILHRPSDTPKSPILETNTQQSDYFQSLIPETDTHQSENLQFVTGQNRGIRKKTKQSQSKMKQPADPKSSESSFSGSFMEKRNKSTTKEVEELDIRRFVEFGKRLGIYFVGNDEAFAAKFRELEEQNLG
ncbi:hypothetical protein SLA2020_456300 [Shorea laevis]